MTPFPAWSTTSHSRLIISFGVTSQVTVEPVDQSQPEMAQRILDLMQRSYRVEAKLIGSNDFPPLRRTLANIQLSTASFLGITQSGNLVAVAELDRRNTIFVSEHATDEEVIEECLFIDSFVVSPDKFRQGLGAVLLGAILQRDGAEKIIVDTSVRNGPAIALYKKAGFSEESVYMHREGFEMIRLKYQAV